MDALLAPDEGPAVEVDEGDGPFVVVCEHASNRLPRSLGTLGLEPSQLLRHIAWDPGASALAEGIARSVGGSLIRQRFSRLAIDCNRDPNLPDAIATLSEDTEIPGNMGLSVEEKANRVRTFWQPFHTALDRLIAGRRGARWPTALVTVHSFTPVYRGIARPWHIGIISTDERSLADAMLSELRREPTLVVGDNQPYSAKDNVDYTIRRHGRDSGLPHVMIEVRNDLLRRPEHIAAWTDRLVEALYVSAGDVGLTRVDSRASG